MVQHQPLLEFVRTRRIVASHNLERGIQIAPRADNMILHNTSYQDEVESFWLGTKISIKLSRSIGVFVEKT